VRRVHHDPLCGGLWSAWRRRGRLLGHEQCRTGDRGGENEAETTKAGWGTHRQQLLAVNLIQISQTANDPSGVPSINDTHLKEIERRRENGEKEKILSSLFSFLLFDL